jgi:hypothetical protein
VVLLGVVLLIVLLVRASAQRKQGAESPAPPARAVQANRGEPSDDDRGKWEWLTAV